MKLNTEEILAPLLRLKQKINAPQVEHELIAIPKPVFSIDIDYSDKEKIEAVNSILNNSSGLFTIDKYSGIFFMYIPFLESFKSYGTLPKFHFMPCAKVTQMKKDGRLDRFRLTSDTSGSFLMSDGHLYELQVCQHCLHAYKRLNPFSKIDPFSIDKFIESAEDLLPKEYVDRVKMGVILPDEYPANWEAISKIMRELNHWRCSLCGVNLHDKPGLLHVHHRNGVKTDTRPQNLQVLCKLCHAKLHGYMDVPDTERTTIESLRAEGNDRKFHRS